MSFAFSTEQDRLDVAFDACKTKKYAQVERLLPQVLLDIENSKLLDHRLVSLIYGMAGFYVSNNNANKAKELYKRLMKLKQRLNCLDCDADFQFEKMAVAYLN